MKNSLRQQILKELFGAVSDTKTSEGIPRLQNNTFSPEDLRQYIEVQSNSGYINDNELELAAKAAEFAKAKCLKPQLSNEEVTWCNNFINLAKNNKFKLRINIWGGTQRDIYHRYADSIKAVQDKGSVGVQPAQPAAQSGQPAAQPGQQEIAGSGDLNKAGASFTCRDSYGAPSLAPVVRFQKWLKTQNPKIKIVADGKFGPLTFQSARSLGATTLNFNAYPNFQVFKGANGAANITKLCTDLLRDNRWRQLDPNPEKSVAQPAQPAKAAAQQAATPAAQPTQKVTKEEKVMNKNARQQILKELNFLLKEQAKNVGFEDAKAGGSWGSGAIGRTLGTSAIGAGAAGLGAYGGATAAIGMGAGAGVAFAAPIAVPLIAVGALYLAFRTAGWQEVSEDVQDANVESSQHLPTGKYLDFTTMSDATDLSDFKSFMAAMKGLTKRFQDVQSVEEYTRFLSNANELKSVTDKICNQYILLNETGLNDRMYFVKCANVRAYNIPEGMKIEAPAAPAAEAPAAGAPATQQESIKRKNKKLFLEAEAPQATPAAPAGAAATPAAPAGKCPKIEGIKIPVELYDIGLEDDVAGPSIGPQRVPAGALPDIVCPLVEQVCGEMSPTPVPGPGPKPKITCKRCKGVGLNCTGADVKEVQDKLIALKLLNATSAEVTKQMFGAETEAAVKKFQESKKVKVDGVVGPQTCRILGISGGGGGGGKKPGAPITLDQIAYEIDMSQPEGERGSTVPKESGHARDALRNNDNWRKTKLEPEFANINKSDPAQVQNFKQFFINSYNKDIGPANPLKLKESFSRNYYDNKKLNEAKQLFNKLLKNL